MFRAIANFFRSEKRSYSIFGGGGRSKAGISVTQDKALSLTPLWAGVDYLSKVVASLSLPVLERLPNGGKSPRRDHPLHDQIHLTPDGEITGWQYRYRQVAEAILTGNSYSEIERDGAGRVVARHLLDPYSTEPKRLESGELVYEIRVKGGTKQLPAEDVLHVRSMACDGLKGRSVITTFREAIGLGLALEEQASRFFANSARPAGILEHPASLTKEQRAELSKEFDNAYGGAGKTGKTLLLTGGIKWQGISLSHKDSEFLASRSFQVIEYARMLGLPPTKLQDYTNSNFSSLEESNLDVVISTLTPWCKNIESEMNWKLFNSAERQRLFVEHNLNSLLRGDSKSRAEFYSKLFNIGAFSVNDILGLENMNPIDDPSGNFHFVPLNMGRLEQPAEQDQPQEQNEASQPPTEHRASDDTITAVKATLDDALGRMARREQCALKRAAKKPEQFLEWIDSFYPDHQATLAEAIAPAVRAYSAVSGESLDSDEIAKKLAEDSRNKLLELAGECTPDELPQKVDEFCDSEDSTKP